MWGSENSHAYVEHQLDSPKANFFLFNLQSKSIWSILLCWINRYYSSYFSFYFVLFRLFFSLSVLSCSFVFIPSRFRFRWFSDSVLFRLRLPIPFLFFFGSLLFSLRSLSVPSSFLPTTFPFCSVSFPSRPVSSVPFRFLFCILCSVPISVGVRFVSVSHSVSSVLFPVRFPSVSGWSRSLSFSVPFGPFLFLFRLSSVRDMFRILFLVSIPPLFRFHSLVVLDSVLISVGVGLVWFFGTPFYSLFISVSISFGFQFPFSFVLFSLPIPFCSFVTIPLLFRFVWFSDSVPIVSIPPFPFPFFLCFESLLYSLHYFSVPSRLRPFPLLSVSIPFHSVCIFLRFPYSVPFCVPFRFRWEIVSFVFVSDSISSLLYPFRFSSDFR